MDGVRLKINPSKTEFTYFGNPVQLNKCTVDSITVDSDLILRSSIVCYLGAWLDSGLSLKTHVNQEMCSSNGKLLENKVHQTSS